MTMKRVNFHLTGQQMEKLRAQSGDTGLTVAELIRRAVDEFLENVHGKEADVCRVREKGK